MYSSDYCIDRTEDVVPIHGRFWEIPDLPQVVEFVNGEEVCSLPALPNWSICLAKNEYTLPDHLSLSPMTW